MNHKQFAVLVGGLVLVALVLLATGRPASPVADQSAEVLTRTITVTGEAEIQAKPDLTILTFAIRSLETSAEQAEVSSVASGVRLRAALAAQGADTRRMETTGVTVTPVLYDDYLGREAVSGFRGESRITVSVKGMEDRIPSMINAALASGAVSLERALYSIEEPEAIKQQAVRRAIENARERASAVALTTGGGVGELVAIEAEVSEGAITAETPGTLVVRATVRASYQTTR